jgi:hypothetical protein
VRIVVVLGKFQQLDGIADGIAAAIHLAQVGA